MNTADRCQRTRGPTVVAQHFPTLGFYGCIRHNRQLPATIETSRQVADIGALLDRDTDRSYDYRLFM